MDFKKLLPFAALAVVALALYLVYKSQNAAAPNIVNQPKMVLSETSWVRIPPGVTDTVQLPSGQKATAQPYTGGPHYLPPSYDDVPFGKWRK